MLDEHHSKGGPHAVASHQGLCLSLKHTPSQNTSMHSHHTQSPLFIPESNPPKISPILLISYMVYPLSPHELVYSQTHTSSSYHHSFLCVSIPAHCTLKYHFIIYSFTNTNKLSYSFIPHPIVFLYSNHVVL